MKFKDSSPEELRDIWENRKEFHLEVTEDIWGSLISVPIISLAQRRFLQLQ